MDDGAVRKSRFYNVIIIYTIVRDTQYRIILYLYHYDDCQETNRRSGGGDVYFIISFDNKMCTTRRTVPRR